MEHNGHVLWEMSLLERTLYVGIPVDNIWADNRALFCVSMFYAARQVSKGRAQLAQLRMQEMKVLEQRVSALA